MVVAGETYKLSLLPSGILHPGKASVIASGVVIDPAALLGEIDAITARGLTIGENLLISDRAHVIFPWHLAEEAALEKHRGDEAIGTTMRGIGTCYRDKIGRTHAIRVGDMMRPDTFKKRVGEVLEQKNLILRALDPDAPVLDGEEIITQYSGYVERLRPHFIDTTVYLHEALRRGKSMLFEGAQGSLLDIDHGTFPYVTSSNSSGCGIHAGSGVPERVIDTMIGVVKAYTSRVGTGPCPTELLDDVGQHIRDEGNEFGTVTGRPRRCGWFDAVATGYGARISGVDSLAVMLLDVLGKLDEIKICEAYEIDGERTTNFPSHIEDLDRARPVYRTVPGWNSDITGIRKLADLPAQTRAYVDLISELVGAPADILSVGPDREQTILV